MLWRSAVGAAVDGVWGLMGPPHAEDLIRLHSCRTHPGKPQEPAGQRLELGSWRLGREDPSLSLLIPRTYLTQQQSATEEPQRGFCVWVAL